MANNLFTLDVGTTGLYGYENGGTLTKTGSGDVTVDIVGTRLASYNINRFVHNITIYGNDTTNFADTNFHLSVYGGVNHEYIYYNASIGHNMPMVLVSREIPIFLPAASQSTSRIRLTLTGSNSGANTSVQFVASWLESRNG